MRPDPQVRMRPRPERGRSRTRRAGYPQGRNRTGKSQAPCPQDPTAMSGTLDSPAEHYTEKMPALKFYLKPT